ncbi:hypothetical protein T459_24608 [Capsicum annuum]|uniref:Aspartic peptidase DDI1-type domain-containing protein n=1 Tax=Capsicum annuum TaxID=4072 RepID=A0A2G2YID0_CAPAN|nr:hypothetical protein T459_24608 [Capsicum annuum]
MNARNTKNKGKDGNTKGCWTCGGPYLAKSYSNHERVNAIFFGNMNQGGGEEAVTTLANPLDLPLNQISLLNVVGDSSKLFATLIKIEIKVDGNRMIEMVDTVATHTFVDAKVAAKYGLKLKKSPSFVQMMNSKEQAIIGMTYDVHMLIGSCTGKHNLMAIPLGDYEVILGIDFLRKFWFIPFPHLDGVMIMDEANPIKLDVKVGVPDCAAEPLRQYTDVMPPELHKELQLRREIDHKIELLPGSIAPAQIPYIMTPKELVELRKQLNELLDADLIQPSKAPYGAPILF